MIRGGIVIAIAASGCGDVVQRVTDAPQAVTYKGALDATTPAAFGGAPFCSYTITLKQLQVELTVLPSGDATSGRVQALNVEANDATCTFDTIPANIATYTLASSMRSGSTTTVTFQGTSTNAPQASLVATLSPAGSSYAAALTFHRTDAGDPLLAWTVMTTVSAAAQ